MLHSKASCELLAQYTNPSTCVGESYGPCKQYSLAVFCLKVTFVMLLYLLQLLEHSEFVLTQKTEAETICTLDD